MRTRKDNPTEQIQLYPMHIDNYHRLVEAARQTGLITEDEARTAIRASLGFDSWDVGKK